MSDAAANAKKMLKGMKGKTVSFTHQASGNKVSGEYRGLKQMGGRSYAHIETGKGAHRVPPHHIHQTQSEGVQESIDDLSQHSNRALKAILDNPQHPMHAAAKDERARRAQNESIQMKTFDQLREELNPLREAKLPSAPKLADHAGHRPGQAGFGTKKQNHPDGSATLKLKLSQDHAKDKDGAHAYATKAADKLKSNGYNVHKVSVRKSEGGFGQPEHTASIHLSHNVKESTIQESVRAFPKGYVTHATIKHWNKEYGDGMDLGHGAHEIEHPHEPGGSARASMPTPSHPHAYAHHDKKTGKVTAVEIKHQKTSAAAVAKAMGHKEVGPHHHAIADEHNEVNDFSESTIHEAAIHTHKDGTTVHHSDEDRGEVYSIKHGGKTHTVNTHGYTVPGETVAGNVKKHIAAQAPGIPSHAKNAIAKHMADM